MDSSAKRKSQAANATNTPESGTPKTTAKSVATTTSGSASGSAATSGSTSGSAATPGQTATPERAASSGRAASSDRAASSGRASSSGATPASSASHELPDARVKVLVEPAAGEFGGLFALLTGLLLLSVSTGIAMFMSQMIKEQMSHLPQSSQRLPADAQMAPDYGETTAFIAFLVLASLATILLLVGAYLGALETRGRLRRRVEPGSIVVTMEKAKVGLSSAGTPIDVEKVIDASAGLLDKIGFLRGATAVIGAAVIVFVCAILVLILA